MIRRLNVPVVDEASFAELTSRRRPVGMSATKPSYQLLRETYFDTSDGVLAAQGMTLRLRSEARGHATMVLTITQGVNLQGIIEEQSFEAPVVQGGFYATLADQSEVATRVRELADPVALRPKAAVDIDRETRELRNGPLGRVTHRIVFDDVIAHAPGGRADLQEVTIIELERGKTALETLSDRLRNDHSITSDGRSTYLRVRDTLIGSEGAPRPEVPADVRVALLVLSDWEVGLVPGDDGLVLPQARGSGEEIAREYLTELSSGSGREDLDLIGFASERGSGTDLEVWLHEASADLEIEDVVWIPLMEVMSRLGGPRLRSPSLIASLLMLVRSETGQRLLREAPNRIGTPVLLPEEDRAEDVGIGEGKEDYLDLELSILDFNQRVLELAEDESLPILERIRFLSIFSTNTDEFFVVRVGRLKEAVAGGGSSGDEDLSASHLLDLVAVRVRALLARQYACWNTALLPRPRRSGSMGSVVGRARLRAESCAREALRGRDLPTPDSTIHEYRTGAIVPETGEHGTRACGVAASE